ncbi:DNA polymerase IV [bacterium]|nr:MAG: DNA polymerase IV [bacterium]
MDRTVMHVDMNAFFASVEQQCNPRLRGRPIAVIGSNKRTVITTASYEARAFGVKTGMNVYEGKKQCPGLIFVIGNNSKYVDASTRIISILRDYTPQVEVFSIDEAFLDVTCSLVLFQGAENIAFLIKKRIKDTLGLTCSIGIAPNKLLAKLASDMEKPDGLVVIMKKDVTALLETVPVGELCGIGRKLEIYLNEMGIKTCGDLGRYPVMVLKRRFGIIGERLHEMGLGIDNSPVSPMENEDEVKSVGHSMTLPRDVHDMQDIRKYLLQLSEMVGRRARRYGYRGRTVILTVRYRDFTTFSRRLSIQHHINNSLDIYRTILRVFGSIRLKQAVRLLGVSLTGLARYSQIPLFAEYGREDRRVESMDRINDRYGEFTITYGALLLRSREPGVISPSWRPSGARRVEPL